MGHVSSSLKRLLSAPEEAILALRPDPSLYNKNNITDCGCTTMTENGTCFNYSEYECRELVSGPKVKSAKKN